MLMEGFTHVDGKTARLDTLKTDVHNSGQQCNKSFICNVQ